MPKYLSWEFCLLSEWNNTIKYIETLRFLWVSIESFVLGVMSLGLFAFVRDYECVCINGLWILFVRIYMSMFMRISN